MVVLNHPFTRLLTIATLIIGLTGCGGPKSQSSSENQALTCAPDLPEIAFAVLTTESQTNLKAAWEPLIDDMTAALDRPVVGFYATDYTGIIAAMGANKVQVAWYGGNSYVEATERAAAEAFAQTVQLDGSAGYYAYLITHKDHPLVAAVDLDAGNGDEQVVKQAAQLTLAFNDPQSTSGFLVPTYHIFVQQEVNAEEIFKEVLFAGNHEATALAVAARQIDVATNNSQNLARLAETRPEALDEIQIIWTSPLIPNEPIAYRNDLPDCLKTQIEDFFLGYDNTAVLESLKWQQFIPAEDTTWDVIRELKLAKAILEIEQDEALNAAERQAKVELLQTELEALQVKDQAD
ncbi:MAG: phosphonate ABC transporter substrate-binding protein [Cyanobacteria bacterium P01_G01_bin.54]